MKVLVLCVLLLAHGLLAVNASSLYKHTFEKYPGHYIVVFKEHVGMEMAFEHVSRVEAQKIMRIDQYLDMYEEWNPAKFFEIPEEDGTPLVGYATILSNDHVESLRLDPDVEYIEQDQIIRLSPIEMSLYDMEDGETDLASSEYSADSEDWSRRPIPEPPEGPRSIQRKQSEWGLSRVSQHDWDDDTRKERIFTYGQDDGHNVTVYIIDTGVDVYHPEFEGRASLGKSFVRDMRTGDPMDAIDQNGHGTHCASTVAGKTFGVAPRANIVAVRVLDAGGSGTLSDVISGVNWATKEHLKNGRSSKSVISMSLGGGPSPTLDRAVAGATVAGVHVIVAAGNESNDACQGSPSRAEKAVTVGATDVMDAMAFFSNFGKCVNVFAPGHRIKGAWLNNGTNIISGTSMATPHVAGTVASYLSRSDDAVSPKKMLHFLEKLATRDAITGLPDKEGVETKNLIAFTCPVNDVFACAKQGPKHPKPRRPKRPTSPESSAESDLPMNTADEDFSFMDALARVTSRVQVVLKGPVAFFWQGN